MLHADAAENYSTLARRLVIWLTTQTSSGILFDIDLRLRPNGNAGLMVSSFDAFSRYQRNEDGLGAWVWETQALTRARYSLRRRRARPALRGGARPDPGARRATCRHCASEVLAMRQKMLDGHPNTSALFDLKHDRGGMVDIEFIVQYLVLAHAHARPELIRNARQHRAAADGRQRWASSTRRSHIGWLTPTARSGLIQHRLRLNGAERARVEPEEVEQRGRRRAAPLASVFGS